MARTFGVAFERERRGVSWQGRAECSLLADVFIYILSRQVESRAGLKNAFKICELKKKDLCMRIRMSLMAGLFYHLKILFL